MNKSKTKKRYVYNQEILEALSEKYGLSKYYIRECVSGKRNSLTSDQLQKEYKKLVKEIESVTRKNKEL